MSLTETKELLAESITLYEQLKTTVDKETGLHNYSEEQWRDHLRELGLGAAKLIHTSRIVDDEGFIQKLRHKQRKLARHREWRKRHKKRTCRQMEERKKLGEQWKEDIVQKVTMTPSFVAQQLSQQSQQQQQQQEKNKDMNDSNAEENTKETIKELSRLLSKLTRLRSLRRKKLEAKGHFFAEEGSEFYNQVKDWHERERQQQLENQQAAVREKTTENDDVGDKEKQGLSIHPEDAWHSMPIDETAYKYWCEADQSLNSLLLTRRLWDQYILHDTGEPNSQEDRLYKVPPIFVNPSPPANWIWATYLQS